MIRLFAAGNTKILRLFGTMHKSTRKKAELIQKMVADNYLPERHDRCKLWVYRNHIRNTIPMSERTFWRYVNMKVEVPEEKEEDKRQLKLFE